MLWLQLNSSFPCWAYLEINGWSKYLLVSTEFTSIHSAIVMVQLSHKHTHSQSVESSQTFTLLVFTGHFYDSCEFPRCQFPPNTLTYTSLISFLNTNACHKSHSFYNIRFHSQSCFRTASLQNNWQLTRERSHSLKNNSLTDWHWVGTCIYRPIPVQGIFETALEHSS